MCVDSSPKEVREEHKEGDLKGQENGPPQLPVKGIPVGFTSAEREVLTTPTTRTMTTGLKSDTVSSSPKPTLTNSINPRFLTTRYAK